MVTAAYQRDRRHVAMRDNAEDPGIAGNPRHPAGRLPAGARPGWSVTAGVAGGRFLLRKSMFFAFAIGTSAILAACNSSGASGLTGRLWQLTAITEKVPAFQGVVPAADRSKYTITFNTDGTFSGSADCNQIAGTYKTSGSDGITITPGISTMAMCGEGSLDVLFVHSLGKAKSYVIANEQLTITLTDLGTLTFRIGMPAGWPEASAGASKGAA